MAGLGSINFGGLASGLDTNKIIDDLVKVDSQPLARLQSKQTELTKKNDTYTTMKTGLVELQNKASELKSASSFGAFSASSSDEEALTVKTSSTANEGNYSVKVLTLAQAKTLSGNSLSSPTSSLGLSGEVLVNNSSLRIRTTDSLTDIKNGINSLNAGVTASVLKVTNTDNRLIITTNTRGEDGFRISNVGATDILGSLGFTDTTKSIRSIEDGSILSADFTSANSTLGSLLNISSQSSGTVAIRNKSVSIDLATDTLSSIRDKINNATIPGVSASVQTVDVNGTTLFRLVVTGTEDFTDDGNVLETLGILERGTSGTYAEFQTGSLSLSDAYEKEINSNTLISKTGAKTGETITITGKSSEGSAVSNTLTVNNNSKVGDVLTAIENAFGGEVDAYIENNRIMVKSTVAGSNSLTFHISAGNQSGGSLDFGTISTVTKGRDRLLVEGADAKLLVNNIEISRNTNEINDILTGLTLNLKKADAGTEINITVQRDRDAIKTKIEEFVSAYNDFVTFINDNSTYNDDTKEAGPLLGDITARTVEVRVRESLRSTVFNGDFAYNQLIQIGIESTTDGKLSINTSKLNTALNENIDSVISLFSATRSSTDNDIDFVYHTEKTAPGTYDVTITRAAEKAEAVSEIIGETIGESGDLEVTDNFGKRVSIGFTGDMNAEDIANAINEEAGSSYAETIRSDTSLKASDGGTIAQNTAISSLQDIKIAEKDTITVVGTNRAGRTFQRIIQVGNGDEVTMQSILDAIESINNDDVVASIDGNGRITVEDRTTGSSKIGLSIETTITGLDFGSFASIQQGRSTVGIRAEVTDDNRIKIAHNEYGASKTITVSGGEALGIVDGTYAGVDVAGTINGQEGVGNGQSLSASKSDPNSRGIIIRTKITPEELESEGPSQGSITLVSGIADLLHSQLNSMTSSVDGFVQAKIDSLKISLTSMETQITNMNKRIELRREQYIRKFSQLEQAMARLQSLQQTLNSSLGSLSSTSIFS